MKRTALVDRIERGLSVAESCYWQHHQRVQDSIVRSSLNVMDYSSAGFPLASSRAAHFLENIQYNEMVLAEVQFVAARY